MFYYPHISYTYLAITLYLLLLIVPGIIGLCHQLILKPTSSILVFANYYIAFNIMLSSLFVACGYLFDGKSMASIQHWNYSPMFIEYGILHAAICLLALTSLCNNGYFKKATLTFYSIYLIFFSINQIIQISDQSLFNQSSAIVELVYSLILCIILFGLSKLVVKIPR